MSTTTNDGGPAFGGTRTYFNESMNREIAEHHEGMTLRQWYAGMALQGMLSESEYAVEQPYLGRLAANAFAYADAMLAHEAPRQPEEA